MTAAGFVPIPPLEMDFVFYKEHVARIIGIRYIDHGGHGYNQYKIDLLEKGTIATYKAFYHELEICDTLSLDDGMPEANPEKQWRWICRIYWEISGMKMSWIK